MVQRGGGAPKIARVARPIVGVNTYAAVNCRFEALPFDYI